MFGGGIGKTVAMQGAGQYALGKPATMGHEQVALGHGRAVAVEDVQRRNRPCWGGVGWFGQLVLGNQGADGLKVRAGYYQKALRFEYPNKFGQGLGHFVGIEMFNVVAGEDGVHGCIGNA